ncbi:hypothetical protein PH552_00160 [Rhizobium sp. CNPSo 3968]|uniref:hypothetical protein n=1 Tax=Rhizobium sp. CNPSo 3968 TaxID=3021408 RepID=UPI00254E3CCC|nr:hypothetical protein [Rhizobium sp. CNPSo 3968]MDK4717760.1 hypothetical protein [Rhizobium sp. CNPSo 3968]
MKINAERAQAASQDVKTKVENYGLIGAAAAVFTVIGIWATFYFGVRADIAALSTRVDAAIDSKDSNGGGAKDIRSSTAEGRLALDLENLRRRLDDVVRENDSLKAQVQTLTGGKK